MVKQELERQLESVWPELGDTFYATDILSKFDGCHDRPQLAKLIKQVAVKHFRCDDLGAHPVTIAGRKTTSEKYRKAVLPCGHVRVELRGTHDAQQTLVIYTSLTCEGRHDDSLPENLLLAVTSRCTYYGALEVQGTSSELRWSKDTGYSSPTDLFEAPLYVGRRVIVESFDRQSDRVEMAIISIDQLNTFTSPNDEDDDSGANP